MEGSKRNLPVKGVGRNSRGLVIVRSRRDDHDPHVLYATSRGHLGCDCECYVFSQHQVYEKNCPHVEAGARFIERHVPQTQREKLFDDATWEDPRRRAIRKAETARAVRVLALAS